MEFKEPKFEVISIEFDDIVAASSCPDNVSKERPSVQSCSIGAYQDEDCVDPTKTW